MLFYCKEGMSIEMFENTKPMIAILTLTMLKLQKQGYTADGVDAYFESKAEQDDVSIGSLEKAKFYYPIKTNSMCLQCHGKPNSNIKSNTLNKIKNLYPNDLATGYNENEIRGIWSITFNK